MKKSNDTISYFTLIELLVNKTCSWCYSLIAEIGKGLPSGQAWSGAASAASTAGRSRKKSAIFSFERGRERPEPSKGCAPFEIRARAAWPWTRRSGLASAPSFTIVELLVVIAIIAILAGMIMPALGVAKEKGITTDCLNSVRQLGFSFINYTSDSKDYYPAAYCLMDKYAADKRDSNWVKYIGLFDLDIKEGVMYPYTVSPQLYLCSKDIGESKVSMAINRQAHLNRPGKIKKPSNKFIILEESGTQNGTISRYTNDGSFAVWKEKSWTDAVRNWHQHGSVYGHVDGHAAWAKLTQDEVLKFCDIFNEQKLD